MLYVFVAKCPAIGDLDVGLGTWSTFQVLKKATTLGLLLEVKHEGLLDNWLQSRLERQLVVVDVWGHSSHASCGPS